MALDQGLEDDNIGFEFLELIYTCVYACALFPNRKISNNVLNSVAAMIFSWAFFCILEWFCYVDMPIRGGVIYGFLSIFDIWNLVQKWVENRPIF